MLDTTPVTAAITRPISTGTAAQVLLAAVARAFPELTPDGHLWGWAWHSLQTR